MLVHMSWHVCVYVASMCMYAVSSVGVQYALKNKKSFSSKDVGLQCRTGFTSYVLSSLTSDWLVCTSGIIKPATNPVSAVPVHSGMMLEALQHVLRSAHRAASWSLA